MSGRGGDSGGRRGNESMAPTQQATPSPSSLVSGLSSEHEHGLTLQTQQPTVTRASQPKPEMKTTAWRQRGNESAAPTQQAPPGRGRGSHHSLSKPSPSDPVSRLSSELEYGLTLQTQQPTVARASHTKPEMKATAVQQQILAASSKALKPPVGIGGMIRANHLLIELSDRDLHHYDISITPEVISRRHKVVMGEILEKHGKTQFDGRKPAYAGRKGFYTAGALPFTSKDFPGSTMYFPSIIILLHTYITLGKQKLPTDLAVEILCRLPVKSVLRFRCLSRESCSVIDSPTFIKRHQICSTNSNKSLVVSGISGICLVDFDSIDTKAVHLHLPSESWFFRTSIVGSCDGLLALYNSKLGIALLNIATRKHLILPQFWSDFDSFSKFYDGFGYDSASDAYKLVRIINSSESLTEVTVYNLRDNTWRKIDDGFPYFLEISHGVGTFVGGSLNWIVGGIDSDFEYDNFILSFDLQKDTFSLVPKPHITDRRFDICIGDLGGSLYLSCNKEYEHAFDIWVMNEYGVEKSWGKLFSFSFERPLDTLAVSPMTRPLAYTKRGDKVLLYRDDRRLDSPCSYNPGVYATQSVVSIHPLPFFRVLQMSQWSHPQDVSPPYKGYRVVLHVGASHLEEIVMAKGEIFKDAKSGDVRKGYFHRWDTFRASKVMQNMALTNAKIDIIYNSVVVEAYGDGEKGALGGLKVKNVVTRGF
ncbi:hypothetical protein Dsin_011190 [Dipteronia sinensis]|uniref:F-box domain-containing protein n=1 Tax=Dipteronia sinensis TaxID=43782 RepID=A0AAE0AUK9_9ROSI|nr:hypothetical protein Dsin_011190 [Dipteronia sinensis]